MLSESLRKVEQFLEAEPTWLDDVPCAVEIEATDLRQHWTVVSRPRDGRKDRVLIKGRAEVLDDVLSGRRNRQEAYAAGELVIESESKTVMWVNLFFERALELLNDSQTVH